MSDVEAVAEPEVFLSTSVAVATGLVGGFIMARLTKRPGVGDVIFGSVGLLVGTQWLENRGPATALALGTVYVGAIGLSHAVARGAGGLALVTLVSSAVAVAAYAFHDRYVTVGLDPAEQP
jgi:hypothetical protein